MTIPPTIPAHIRTESIAGHEAAIDKIVESIAELIPLHRTGKVNRLINQQLAGYRCLLSEWKEMRDDSTRT